MRTSLASATLVVGLLALMPAAAIAQTNAAQHVSRYGIAVVDISYIFKNHANFKATMEAMKADVQATENALRQERRTIAQQEEQLKQFQPGSPDYKRLDEQITKTKADFNVRATQQRKGFLEREAKNYYKTFLEVNDAVKYYAQKQNIGLVLRFNGDPIDPNKREDVLRAINKPVVFQNGIDITPDILRIVNRTPVATNPRTGPSIPPRK